ncbi:hypothetical protein [Caenimonas aquaedulcis]|uniref:Uncharacterized protein n=1 Tax=Caenimonas aquaedulcis TaxID=2793270 RepID=A0A931H622_9BURK|nr:hypothetical protein [Caenimonas aquaedulcis]MBG9389331.1 hypothetical protein [Caenimonas aquaedulcis]
MTFKFAHLKAAAAANAANRLTPAAESTAEPISKLAALATTTTTEPPLGVACWDDESVATFERRLRRFEDLKLPDAEALAERLAARDFEGDDRVLCVECRHCRPRACAVRDAWLPRILQRCDTFAHTY